MRITPLDIQSHAFARRAWGYDREEVASFLRVVADDYEALIRENDRLAGELERATQRVEELSSNEQLLKETLLTAQSVGDELRRSAVKEAEVLISEAEVQGEKIIDAAHRRAARLAQDIREMSALRSRLAATLRTAIETHLKLVDTLAEGAQDDPVVTGKVAYLDAGGRGERGADADDLSAPEWPAAKAEG